MPKPGGTTDRGYGARHQAERERWKPIVDRGDGHCHAKVCLHPSRWIQPGTRWHLGHNPERTVWTGPEHERCNTSEGATRGNQQRRTTPQDATPPRRRVL